MCVSVCVCVCGLFALFLPSQHIIHDVPDQCVCVCVCEREREREREREGENNSAACACVLFVCPYFFRVNISMCDVQDRRVNISMCDVQDRHSH